MEQGRMKEQGLAKWSKVDLEEEGVALRPGKER